MPPTRLSAAAVSAYLERIGLPGTPPAPSAETLRALHRAHLETVPFENLSIHLGEPIVLDVEALFEKIVTRRRGGFCYELNGLFAALLRALGFRVELLSARVAREDGTFSPEFDHMALAVHLDEPRLADVGFGELFRDPLRLAERGEQPQGDAAYRLPPDGPHLLLEERRGTDPAWQAQYRFTLQPYELADYAEMCHYHQTSPASHFTQKRICSLARPDGRISLSGMRLITTQAGERSERTLDSLEEWVHILQESFGITLRVP
jgi:N-hydroxyarylamine O-acetyltransferase